MTVIDAPARPRPGRTGHPSPMSLWRLLWLELRRNAMPWMFPLLALLFVFDPFRTAMDYPPLWDLRASVVVNKLLPDFVAFVAGVAAWMGSRDSRRHTADLVTATPRPRWTAWLVTWAATAIWAVILYLCGVAVIYGVTATQATWGHPLWWPVAVGCAELAVVCALGFAVGTLFPSRFTAPLAAVGAFFLSLEGFHNAVGQSSGYALLSPTTSVPPDDIGVFYHYLPDVAIAQLMFLLGLTAVVLGGLGLARAAGAGRRLRRAAAVLSVVGLAATGTAIGLVGTAHQGTSGEVIPALHDAANDRLIAFTPVCSPVSGIPVCVHPAYRPYAGDVTAAFRPVLSEVAGLPGAPARITQIGDPALSPPTGKFGGSPPVFEYSMPVLGSAFGQTTSDVIQNLQDLFVAAFIAGPRGFVGQGGTPAQQVVQIVLLKAIGSQWDSPGPGGGPESPAMTAAVTRFAAVPAGARHAWLTTHLAALRAGHITLAQLP
jgi:ABC-type transport system involved in multi-copper enzyme maturation permease subunit